MSAKNEILFPVGRMVLGDLYTANTKDSAGVLKTVKTGPNAGQPRAEYFVGIAITKGQEQHWAQTVWGQVIYSTGAAAFPQQHQSAAFAWKVEDGDSAVPNIKGRKNSDNTNLKGCWLIKFSSGFAPKIVDASGRQEITEAGAVKCGYYVQMFGSVAGNGSTQSPGVFMNIGAVALSGYGTEIQQTRDFSAVGFGGALPPGASAVPVAAMVSPPAGVPGMPSMPAFPVVPPVAHMPPVNVQPNTAYMAPPAAPMVPPLPPAAPAARQMTAKAAGATYETFVGNGWTDAQMIQHGYLIA